MNDALNNPVWNAMISGNSHLATGSERVKIFDGEVSPFAGMISHSPENFDELYALHTSDRPILLWSGEELTFSKWWKVIDCIPGYQMVYEQQEVPAYQRTGITPLGNANVPEMLELTKLTKPGPFNSRTIEFGNYEGIFADGKLVAMTGQRFQPFDHVEISAVCTHPDHLGRGYAKQLLLSQLTQILGNSLQPHLHVRSDNERAIHVYKSLGFSVRMPVYFHVIKK
jgi:ribosomal protein S18 acetylase RimI-like enzyme